jgi:hypothetical protein
MKRRLGFLPLILFVFVSLAGLPATASATPVLWTLNATESFNGSTTGTVAGSFVYNADTNQYSSVAITMTSPAASFDTSEIGGPFAVPNAFGVQFIDSFVPGANAGKPTLLLRFAAGLTNLGGSVSLGGSSDAGICIGDACASILSGTGIGGGDVSGNVTGRPVTSAVPEPATLVLCSAGLLGAGVRRWRQRRA